MVTRLHITHLTDLHISPDDNEYRGMPVRNHFLRSLEKINRNRPDVLVLTGDLAAHNGEPESYAWLRSQLDDFACPYEILPGNHDNLTVMRQFFDLPRGAAANPNSALFYQKEIHGLPLLFLDTSPHTISQEQLEWLAGAARALLRPALLFLHHPLGMCGCRFMDQNYALQNGAELSALLRQTPHIPYVFCGHYHIEKTIVAHDGGPTVFITPSTLMQIRDDTPQFVVNHAHPGWRDIVWDGEWLHTRAEYVWL